MKKHVFTHFLALILMGGFMQLNKIDAIGPVNLQGKNERTKKR